MTQDRLLELAERAIQRGMKLEDAIYLAARVGDRIDRGHGHDCDEYRALIREVAS